ncbi:MAG: NYN domain-containing protein [Patescibacteria group bacterium]|nr:NYN domain-containing protein [Patescibacteria group bacterium]
MKKSLKHKDQRVGVFIDVSNMYMSAQNLYKTNVNFKAVLKKAVAGRRLVRAFAYVIETESGKEQRFFEILESQGYEVRTKPLQIFKSGAKKGDWDVGLTIDVVRLMPILDTVVVVSGDGDYQDLLDYLRGHGRRAEVMAFGQTTSHKLLDEADEFIDMSKEKKKFLI